jgi:Xaa-Pro aminopeptidase
VEPFHERCLRAGELARAEGADSLLVTDPATVRWLTGVEQDIEFGPMYPFTAGTLVQLRLDGTGYLIVSSDDEAAAPAVRGLVVKTYEAYSLGLLRPFANAHALLDLRGTVAVEGHSATATLLDGVKWVDVGTGLRWLRTVKDAEEIVAIRKTCAVISTGQRAFRSVAGPGRREIEVFSDVHAAMEAEARRRVPVSCDLLSGPRVMEVGRPPTDRVMAPDELALCDLLARHGGQWADSCTTICLGKPTAEMRRLHDSCRRALDAVLEAARPGAVAGDLDRLARSQIAEAGYTYPHHTGHGVGSGLHEEPRIVPDATATLEAGMVIAFEPAGFAGGIGARIEHTVLIGAHGPEILTDYETRLDQ